MHNKLEPILLQKQREVADLHQRLARDDQHLIAKILRGELKTEYSACFKNALTSSTLSVIAEIKRKSPSKGVIAPIINPVSLAQKYISGGASALSILTDKEFFGGGIDDLIQVSNGIQKQSVPILRKDFIIDDVQIAEALVSGASAVLCIIAAVGMKAKSLIECARAIGLDVLVEIHNHDELNIALDCGADIIGINNRNLNTFEVNIEASSNLISAIPHKMIKVAESGITDPALARYYHQAGFDAVLIGEALVKSADPEQFISACRHD